MKNLNSFQRSLSFVLSAFVLGQSAFAMGSSSGSKKTKTQNWFKPIEGRHVMQGSPGCEDLRISFPAESGGYAAISLAGVLVATWVGENNLEVSRNLFRSSFSSEGDGQPFSVAQELRKDENGNLIFVDIRSKSAIGSPNEISKHYVCRI